MKEASGAAQLEHSLPQTLLGINIVLHNNLTRF